MLQKEIIFIDARIGNYVGSRKVISYFFIIHEAPYCRIIQEWNLPQVIIH